MGRIPSAPLRARAPSADRAVWALRSRPCPALPTANSACPPLRPGQPLASPQTHVRRLPRPHALAGRVLVPVTDVYGARTALGARMRRTAASPVSAPFPSSPVHSCPQQPGPDGRPLPGAPVPPVHTIPQGLTHGVCLPAPRHTGLALSPRENHMLPEVQACVAHGSPVP